MGDVAYYPQKRYVEQGLRGETALKTYDFVALAFAQKRAVEQGVLTKEQAKYMIPMAMVEGRSGNYGIKAEMALYAKPATLDRFQKMGLSIADMRGKEDQDPGAADLVVVNEKRGNSVEKFLVLNPNHPNDSPAKNSRVMAALLAEKASLKGVATPEDAVKRYNGKGKSMEDVGYGEYHPADVDKYLQKVQEAHEMLMHPSNAQLQGILGQFGAQQ